MDNIETTKNKAEEKKPHKLFDYCMSNPPYQVETQKAELKKGCQKTVKSVFPVMQDAVDSVTEKGSVMIYPAGRWIHRSGKGMKEFGLEQINDPHLSALVVYPDSGEVFPGVEIADGISIVSKRMNKDTQEFRYNYKKGKTDESVVLASPGADLIPIDPKDAVILKKIEGFVSNNNLRYLHDYIFPRKMFSIESDFIEKNPDVATALENVKEFNSEAQVKLLTNNKAGKAGRVRWYVVDRSVIPSGQEYIDEWQVVASSASPGGQKRDSQLTIIDNHSAFGRARVALASFKTESEAQNFLAYVKSYIIRYTFLMTDEALTSLGLKVPDLVDYASSNPLVDFSNDIDTQLCELIGFTDEEFEYIKKTVKERGHGI